MTFATQQLRLGLLVALLFLACAVTLHCQPMPAHADARPIASCQWTPLAGIALARLVVHESRRDVLPIAETVRNRWLAHGAGRNESFADSVISTSSFLRRARYAMERDAALESQGAPRRYEAVRIALDVWASGDAPVACRGVPMQWRSPRVRTLMKRVDCGDSANDFVEHPEPHQTRAVVAIRSRGEPECPR